jgi:hypothetical protein
MTANDKAYIADILFDIGVRECPLLVVLSGTRYTRKSVDLRLLAK